MIDLFILTFKRFHLYLLTVHAVYFVLIFAGLSIFMKFPGGLIGYVIAWIFHINGGIMDSDMQLPTFELLDFINAWLLAPLVETIGGQLLPLALAARFTKNDLFQVLFSAMIFSLMHLPVVEFLPTAFLIGLCLAWAYKLMKQRLSKSAFFYTAVIHCLTNSLPIITIALIAMAAEVLNIPLI